MNPITGAAMYVVVWWITLFAVLPFGTRPQPLADSDTGWRGVPERPRMLRKLLVNSLVAALVWGLLYGLITSDWISFRHGWLALPEE